VPEPDRVFMRAATAVLQARNRHLAGIGDLDLVIDFPAELADALVPFLRLLEPAASTPLLTDDEVGRLFMRLGAGFGADAAAAGRLAGSIGTHGLGALIDIPAFERIASELAELPGPLVVRIDATTLSRLTVESATGALFVRLVEAFHGRGIRLLVDGIRDERGFHAALDAGADLLCGDFVGRGRLTGEAFDREPRPIGVRDRSGPFPSAHAERK
jgi:hypothetical protein